MKPSVQQHVREVSILLSQSAQSESSHTGGFSAASLNVVGEPEEFWFCIYTPLGVGKGCADTKREKRAGQ